MRTIRFIIVLPAFIFSFYSTYGLEIKFGIYTSDKPVTVVKQFRPILNTIENRLSEMMGESVKIRMQVAKSYKVGIRDLVTGQVDLARMGPASYIESKDANPAISILAVESNGGEKIFYGTICVMEESEIWTINDLKGKRFAFGNERSTIGRYLSQQFLLNHTIRARDLAHYEYLKRHDKVGAAVLSGSFNAGALKENTYNNIVANGGKLRALGSFPNVTKPWIAREGLSSDIKESLRQVLLQLENPAALDALKKDGFLPGHDDDYELIRESIRNNHKFFE